MNEDYEIIDVNSEFDSEIEVDNLSKEDFKEDKNSEQAFEKDLKVDRDECCEGEFCDKFEHCEIIKDVNKQITLECQGRLLRLKLKLKDLCGGNYVNLGVVILTMDNKILGFRVKKFKVIGPRCSCVDVCKEFCFAFEDKNICAERKFKVRIIAQYC
ncbi:hypothetical protein [Clostridium grantii]|uniref:Uncharacterized protein n=1 Tax=Clostridium grantii DSM 8605 TaxID=1121316 RepID=A0A1M5XA10_9CLOT|nr:hypothetical protein [Clostridium grantii]SHH96697.1 hypothetical protein SAMN02745207_03486 [Clostridium grantii DSM 8605]